MDRSRVYDYILSGQRWKDKYRLIVSQTRDPDLVFKFIDHVRVLLSFVGGYPDIVHSKLKKHFNAQKILIQDDHLAFALIKSWTYHASALCYYKAKDYKSAYETLSAALVNDCDIYSSYKIRLIADSIFMLSSRLLDMSLLGQPFERLNRTLKYNLLKSLSSGILKVSNYSINIFDYIESTNQFNAVLYAYPMNRIFFQDIMSHRSNKMNASMVIRNIKKYTHFVGSHIGDFKPVSDNNQVVAYDPYSITLELRDIINLECLLDTSMLKFNKIKLQSPSSIRLNCSSAKNYFVSKNELKLIKDLCYA